MMIFTGSPRGCLRIQFGEKAASWPQNRQNETAPLGPDPLRGRKRAEEAARLICLMKKKADGER